MSMDDINRTEQQEKKEGADIPKVLEDFLDAETVEQKRRIIEERSSEIDERTLLNIELSLDIVAKNGATLDDRIGYVMYYLRTRGRFETTRLR
ncbi:MAG: hypothetical protein K6E85_09940 [Lachnospiraceae bacterium]|nr:hypothetical protein [Lachnospiraceae bacterium]